MSNAKRKAQLEQIAADLERMSDRARYGVSEQTRQGWRDHARIAREIGEELVAATPEAGPTDAPTKAAFDVTCPSCAVLAARLKDDDDLLFKAESWLYHSATFEERRKVAAEIRALICKQRGDDPWRDSQRDGTAPTGQRSGNPT